MRLVKCKSGISGWQEKLRKVYNESFESFVTYCEIFGIDARLGYENPEDAWNDNPTIQGSVIPSDFRKVE